MLGFEIDRVHNAVSATSGSQRNLCPCTVWVVRSQPQLYNLLMQNTRTNSRYYDAA